MEVLKHECGVCHGPVTKAFGILSSEVWNLDVWAQ